MIRDCVFWIIFSIAQSQFFKDDWRRSCKWLTIGTPTNADHLLPTSQRITVISVLHEANRWGEVRLAIDHALSVIPWSLQAKIRIKSVFNNRVEAELERAIGEYITEFEDRTSMPLFQYNFNDSSDDSSDELPLSCNSTPRSPSFSYVGTTSSDLATREAHRNTNVLLPPSSRPARNPIRDSHQRAQMQLAMHVQQHRLPANQVVIHNT